MKIRMWDGQQFSFTAPISVAKLVRDAYPESVKEVIAAKVDGELVDLSHLINGDHGCQLLTAKDAEGLEILRHSAAHLLAQAVTELFPGVQVTVGPATKDGFYHDFYYPEGISENDLPRIEKRMLELSKMGYPIERSEKNRQEALAYFEARHENYKVLMINDIKDDVVSFYTQGDFTNACRGPHVPNTGFVEHFKLTKISGAYWKGDAKNAMLIRIYGTAWATAEDLEAYLAKVERAKLADHRLIGKKMDLFHLQDEAPGMVFWHPRGWTIFTTLRQFLARKLRDFGYEEVSTPTILDRVLWEKSGHWENYQENMFVTESEKCVYAVKPMNCPGQLQIFKQGLKSYRDLPVRYCEFGLCHRNEVSGSLHGIMRVRAFTQDDGHILCTEDQIASESSRYIEQVMEIYQIFGFDRSRVTVKLSTRPTERIGSDAIWDKAENALAKVLDDNALNWQYSPGEGAFYGPKIEFSLKDSLDRFIGILLEDTAGHLPIWLAPVQAVAVGVTDAQNAYLEAIRDRLNAVGYRVIADTRNEKLGFKIREHTLAKIPLVLIAGNKEMQAGTVSVRTLAGKDLGQMTVEKLLADVMIVDGKFR